MPYITKSPIWLYLIAEVISCGNHLANGIVRLEARETKKIGVDPKKRWPDLGQNRNVPRGRQIWTTFAVALRAMAVSPQDPTLIRSWLYSDEKITLRTSEGGPAVKVIDEKVRILCVPFGAPRQGSESDSYPSWSRERGQICSDPLRSVRNNSFILLP